MSSYQLFDALPAHIEAALRDSIEEFGVIVPVVIDQNGQVIDGHHRSRIADSLGVDYPVENIHIDDDEQAARLAYTLNADRRQLQPSERMRAAARLRERGHSYRAIGEALGTDDRTVRRDIAKAGEAGAAPEPDEVRGRDGKSYPAKRPEPAPEPVRAEEPASGTEESPPLDLEKLPGAEDRAYVRAFVTAIGGWHKHTGFDPERLAEIADPEVAKQVEMSASAVARFAETFKRARSGLRVVDGGKR